MTERETEQARIWTSLENSLQRIAISMEKIAQKISALDELSNNGLVPEKLNEIKKAIKDLLPK